MHRYKTLSGKVPYHDQRHDHLEVMELFRGNRPQRPHEPAIADEHWALIQHYWHADPSARSSVDEVYESLKCHREALP